MSPGAATIDQTGFRRVNCASTISLTGKAPGASPVPDDWKVAKES